MSSTASRRRQLERPRAHRPILHDHVESGSPRQAGLYAIMVPSGGSRWGKIHRDGDSPRGTKRAYHEAGSRNQGTAP